MVAQLGEQESSGLRPLQSRVAAVDCVLRDVSKFGELEMEEVRGNVGCASRKLGHAGDQVFTNLRRFDHSAV
jgi:hypothetical protein